MSSPINVACLFRTVRSLYTESQSHSVINNWINLEICEANPANFDVFTERSYLEMGLLVPVKRVYRLIIL